MATLAALIAKLGVDATEWDAAWDAVSKKQKQVTQGLEDLGTRLTVGVTAPMLAVGAAGVKAFGDFEGALNKVSALGDIYGKDLERLKAQAMDLGAKTQFSATQAAEGMANLAAAGFKANEVFQAMPGVLNLAAAGQLGVGRAAEIAKDLMGQFGLEASKSQMVADLLAKAGSEASGSLNDIAESMKYVGPVANAAGFNIQETTAALVELDKAGIRGSEAGTGLRGVLASMAHQSMNTAQVMKRNGIDISFLADSTHTFSEKIQLLKNEFEGIIDPTARMGLAMQLFGRESVSTALVLMDAGKPALDAMTKSMFESEGMAQKQAQTLNSGLNGALEKMRGSVETAGIALGNVLAPNIIKIAGLIEQGANKVAEFITWFNKLPEPVKNVTMVLGGLVASAGPVALLIAQGIKTVETLKALGPAFTLVGTGFKALSTILMANPYAALIAATVALVVLIVANWDKIKAALAAVWDWIKKTAATVAEHIVDAFEKYHPLGIIIANWDKVKAYFTGLAKRAVEWGADIVAGLAKGIRDSIGQVINSAQKLAGDVTSAVKNFFGIRSPSTAMFEVGTDVTEGLALGIEGGAGRAVQATGEVTRRIKEHLDGFQMVLADIQMRVAADFNEGTKQFLDSVGKMGNSLITMMNPLSVFSAILDKINPAGTAVAAMLEVLEPIIKVLQEPFRILGKMLGTLLLPILTALIPVFKALAIVFAIGLVIIGSVWNAIVSAVQTILRAINIGGWANGAIAWLDTIKIDVSSMAQMVEEIKNLPTTTANSSESSGNSMQSAQLSGSGAVTAQGSGGNTFTFTFQGPVFGDLEALKDFIVRAMQEYEKDQRFRQFGVGIG